MINRQDASLDVAENAKGAQKLRPSFIAVLAQSLDGFIANSRSDPLPWIPKEDKLWFKHIAQATRHVVIGRQTFLVLPKVALKNRIHWVLSTRSPQSYVFRLQEHFGLTNLDLTPVFTDKLQRYQAGQDTVQDAVKIYRLSDSVFWVHTSKGSQSFDTQLKTLLRFWYEEGIKKMVIAGGAHIYDLFFRKDLVDELYLTIVMTVLGQGIAWDEYNYIKRFQLQDILTKSTDYIRLYFKRKE